jgi:hypothetical protein
VIKKYQAVMNDDIGSAYMKGKKQGVRFRVSCRADYYMGVYCNIRDIRSYEEG